MNISEKNCETIIEEIEELIFNPDFPNRFFLLQFFDNLGLKRRLENLRIYHPFYHTIITQYVISSDFSNEIAPLNFFKELLLKHPDKAESWFLYWFYANKSYKNIHPQYSFIADTKAKVNLNHPASVVKCFLCKIFLLQFVDRLYIPIPPNKILKYVRKDNRHFNDWGDILIYMQFKSYLRYNLIDSLEILLSLYHLVLTDRKMNNLFNYHLARISVKCHRAIHEEDNVRTVNKQF